MKKSILFLMFFLFGFNVSVASAIYTLEDAERFKRSHRSTPKNAITVCSEKVAERDNKTPSFNPPSTDGLQRRKDYNLTGKTGISRTSTVFDRDSQKQAFKPQEIEEEVLVDLMERVLNKDGSALYHMSTLYYTGFKIIKPSGKIKPLRASEKLNTCLFDETCQKQASKPQKIEEEVLVDLMEHALNKDGSALYHMGMLYLTGFNIIKPSCKINPLRALNQLNACLFGEASQKCKR